MNIITNAINMKNVIIFGVHVLQLAVPIFYMLERRPRISYHFLKMVAYGNLATLTVETTLKQEKTKPLATKRHKEAERGRTLRVSSSV